MYENASDSKDEPIFASRATEKVRAREKRGKVVLIVCDLAYRYAPNQKPW